MELIGLVVLALVVSAASRLALGVAVAGFVAVVTASVVLVAAVAGLGRD